MNRYQFLARWKTTTTTQNTPTRDAGAHHFAGKLVDMKYIAARFRGQHWINHSECDWNTTLF
jgi:hypothetical protein